MPRSTLRPRSRPCPPSVLETAVNLWTSPNPAEYPINMTVDWVSMYTIE